jgi:hypothetical protein
VGAENFEWIVDAVASMAIQRAQQPADTPRYQWSAFLENQNAGRLAATRGDVS